MATENKKGFYNRGMQLLGLILVLPALLFILMDIAIPIIWNVVLSFQRWSGLGPIEWAGFSNFTTVITDEVTRTSFVNSIIIAVVSGLIAIIGGLLLAVLIFRMSRKEGAFYRLVFFTPNMLPLTVVGLLFVFIYNPDVGLLNNVLGAVGLDVLKHAWLAENGIVLMAIAFTGGWKVAGLTMMLCYTAIASIPSSLLEAGKIDGAGYFKQVRMVILPMIKPTIQMCSLLTIIITFKTYDLVYVMTKGGPGDMSRTVPLRMLDVGFIYSEFGHSAAIGTVFTLIVMVIVFVIRKATRGEVYEY